MKKFAKIAFTTVCAGALALSLGGCDAGKCTNLGKPVKASAFDYSEYGNDGYIGLKNKSNDFAYKLSADVYGSNSAENFSVAPISVFSALSLAAECAGGETRNELLSALNVRYEELNTNFSKLYRSLECEKLSSGGNLECKLTLSNSVWINEGVQYEKNCITNLSEKYFAYSYSADFANDNANANKAVRAFVKDKTRKVIDKDFNLSTETVFTLINALYLKDIWNDDGHDLGFTDEQYAFTNKDGGVQRLKLLSGYYNAGRVREYDGFTSFYTETYNGYKIKFILPDEGRSAEEIFTSGNLATVNRETDFGFKDDVNKIRYYTRCLFPEFKTSYDNSVSEILQEKFGLKSLFNPSKCDFSTLTPELSWCGDIRHVNTLTVNKKGIEGAAVTVIPVCGSAGPDEYTEVYKDFVVDRTFGFILTDRQNTVLFTGVVNNVGA